ncbi:hypothetical protein CIG75_02955 [Tumebacillus algifaecis]|uniref:5-bromo-4-chloroindolyl phosphate hydrolysis protein n=1 Tax=Tumebacillus algifaecis TaxID=1214604 RepID=A0A223CXL8_9BACL|nr:hypothetical protein [Tumebacillus algifaecis]ASS74041.1 hypothetical protein CIG75_02955 [Tumebacillus algifaecis]
MIKKKVVLWTSAGYLFALITSPIIPELFSLLIPLAGLGTGVYLEGKKKTTNIPDVVPIESAEQNVPPEQDLPPKQQPEQRSRRHAEQVSPEFAPVLEYLEILEDMIISEGQKNNLDDEIVDKSLALFARLQRVIPLLQELNNDSINHTIRRLVLKDLNGFITPFLRLSSETKTKNRRMLLNGLKDINMKITSIVETIEHKDLIELQTKADLIHSRYSDSDQY